MDIHELKALAQRLKSFLNSKGHSLKHGHALELVAAIPGLRSWAEVTAFPDRVAAASLNDHSAHRMCARLASRRIQVTVAELRDALATFEDEPLAVWPAGPAPGIYVTTNEQAVTRALERFSLAAPAALMFCEQVGASADLAIDLGDNGVFSPGLEKAPRGSLVVLGPLEFVEEAWDDLGNRLRCATNLAIAAGHRIVVLVRTPSERTLHFDLSRLVRWKDSPPDYVDEMLRGVVADDGSLVPIAPFIAQRPQPMSASLASKAEFPKPLAELLRDALAHRETGIIAVSAGLARDRYELLEAALPIAARGRPAARIQPDFRGGYGNEPPLSGSFDGIEVCASIEAAYALGYRVMVIEKPFGKELVERSLTYSKEVCFLLAGFGSVEMLFLQTMSISRKHEAAAMAATIALLCVADIESATGAYPIYDAYIARPDLPESASEEDGSVYGARHRALRWEDAVRPLLSARRVTRKEIESGLRGYMLSDFWSAEA